MSEQPRDAHGRFGPTSSAEAPVTLHEQATESFDPYSLGGRRVLLGSSQASLDDWEIDRLGNDELDLPPGPDDEEAVEHALRESGRIMDARSTPAQLARDVRVAVFHAEYPHQGVQEADFALRRHSHADGAYRMSFDQELERLRDGGRDLVEMIVESSRNRSGS